MASTITITNSLNWVQAYALGRSLSAFTASEPAITCANIILQTCIAAPFTWNWNRSSVTFLTTAATQDYIVSAATFGIIEKAGFVPAASITNVVGSGTVATITANNAFNIGDFVNITGLTHTAFNVVNAVITAATPTTFSFASVTVQTTVADAGVATSGKVSEITNMMNVLGPGSEPGSPNSLAAQIDDNTGNITFRILPVPDATYQITVVYQKRIPALISSLSTTWAPIPDHYAYIYQWGFLALLAAYSQDPRWSSFNQKFVGMLLGAAEGLDQDQKNIFQKAWLNSITEQQIVGMQASQGVQARGI